MVCVPIALTVVFIWTLVESLQSNFVYEGEKQSSAKDTGLTVMSFIPLILNLLYIKVIFDNKHRINQTVSVIEVRTDFLVWDEATQLRKYSQIEW